MTERTVEALRALAKRGKISRDHKRRLLSDIIHHHMDGDSASSIEIAYELLVAPFVRPPEKGYAVSVDNSKEEECLEDFAAQASTIASRLKY